MAYDEVGNLVSKIDFNGQTTTYDYDDFNDRLIEVNYAEGSTETFEYDAVGNRTKAIQTDPNGNSRTTIWEYDLRDRLIREEKPSGDILEYEYDDAGNKTKLTKTVQTNTGPVVTTETYTYDDLNRLETVTDHDGKITSHIYDKVGNRKSMRYPNNNVADYTYDSLNRLTELTISNGATTLFEQYRYTLYPTGRRTKIEELNGRVTSYQYDKLYRLTQETVTDPVNGNYSASYQYDRVGNRTQSIIDGVITSYSYDLNDRLLSAGGTTYTYDNNGNTLTKTENGTTTYGYDPRDRLVSVTDGQNTAATYEYNVDGIRAGKTENGEVIRYLLDQNRDYAQVVTEVTNGAVEVQYLYGDNLIAQDRAGNLSYYLYDGLGSTRALSDGAGSLTNTYHYDAFGIELARTGNTPNDYLFAGEQFDSETGHVYLRNRYYDPYSGRFTQMDRFQGVMHDPVTLHKYLYANIDPVNNIDPTGKFSIVSLGSTMLTGGIVNASLTFAFSGGNATISELGKAFGVGAVLAPVGGGLSVLAGPLIRSMAQPLLTAVGRMQKITLIGRSAWEKALVRMSRVFVNTNVKYPSVGGSFFGNMLKRMLPNLNLQQHHIFIQQAWTRAGSSQQLYQNLAANEGLRRIGNGLWNLMPIPASLNNWLGRSPVATQVFATFYYSLATFGPFHLTQLVSAAEGEEF